MTTPSNNSQMHNDIMAGPYILTEIVHEAVLAIREQLAQPRRVEQETYCNTTPESRKLIDAEAEAIHMILNGIGDDIYSTVDTCSTTREMWLAIKCLQQVESISKQDVKTKLFWEFGKFTLRDGESIKSYYSRFYKRMNEMIARNANPLALIAATQHYPDTHYQAQENHKPYAPSSRQKPSTRSHAPTRNIGKEIAKLITPSSESASEEVDSDLEQAQRDKDMQKNLALIAKYIKNIYKPTNNNLRTSSNTRNKNVDTSPKNINDNQTGQFLNLRARIVVGARKTIRNQAKDYEYYKEKMMLCKQESKGVPLSAEQEDWLHNTDDELDKPELEAHYMYIEKIQEVPTADSRPTYDSKPLEKVHSDDNYNVFPNERQHFKQPKSINYTYMVETVDSNVTPNSSNMCDNEGHANQNAKNRENERVLLASLIANFKLDLDENKRSQRKLKKANTSITQELNKSKQDLKKTKQDLEISKQDLK
ncbi:hypothetical protein Tco_1010928 [Tanacetum coccineum]